MKFKVTLKQVLVKTIIVDAASEKLARIAAVEQVANDKLPEGSKLAEISVTSMSAVEQESGAPVLIQRWFSLGSTVALMDKFDERLPDGSFQYKRLLMKHFTVVTIEGARRWVDLIIERYCRGKAMIGNVTLTELKRTDVGVTRYVHVQVKKACENGTLKTGEDILFEVPYHLRAQTSVDRMPGGWEYGTKYGDTSDYMIVGVRLDD